MSLSLQPDVEWSAGETSLHQGGDPAAVGAVTGAVAHRLDHDPDAPCRPRRRGCCGGGDSARRRSPSDCSSLIAAGRYRSMISSSARSLAADSGRRSARTPRPTRRASWPPSATPRSPARRSARSPRRRATSAFMIAARTIRIVEVASSSRAFIADVRSCCSRVLTETSVFDISPSCQRRPAVPPRQLPAPNPAQVTVRYR